MKTWIAILFTLVISAACYGLSVLVGFNLVLFLVFGTALWAAIDSSELELKRYKSGISSGPVAFFIGCTFLWLVIFPWYLSMRYRIKTGTAVLKN